MDVQGENTNFSIGPNSTLHDYMPIFTGVTPYAYNGFIAAAAIQNVETTPALAAKAPQVALTTTATSGRFNISLPITEVAVGTRMLLRSGSTAIIQINGNAPATSGLRRPGILCLTNAMQVMIRFDGQYWVIEDAPPTTKGEVELTASATVNFNELHAILKMNNAGAAVYTFPSNATRQIPIGAEGEIWHAGAGALSLAAGGGATLVTRGGLLNSAGTGSRINWRKTGTDTFNAWGDLA